MKTQQTGIVEDPGKLVNIVTVRLNHATHAAATLYAHNNWETLSGLFRRCVLDYLRQEGIDVPKSSENETRNE